MNKHVLAGEKLFEAEQAASRGTKGFGKKQTRKKHNQQKVYAYYAEGCGKRKHTA